MPFACKLPNRTKLAQRAVSVFALVLLLASFPILKIPQVQTVSAAVNSTLNFQGKIVNIADGTNVVAGSPACVLAGADTCDLRASIYTDASGGTLLWRESHLNVELGDYEGIFNLSLNSVCNDWEAPSGSCSGSGLVWGNDSTVYLQIEFDVDGNGDFSSAETFSRKLLTSVPYAYEADKLDGIDSTGFVQLAPSTAQNTGNISNPLIYLNENGTGTPNLMQLSVAGSDIFTIGNSGDITTVGDFNVNGGNINSTSVLTFNDSLTNDIAFSDALNTSLPAGTNSILHALNAASGGGGGLWTINGNVTYLTSSGSDLSLSSTLVSAFSVDESENLVRVGEGSGTNGKLDLYSSTGNTGRFEYIADTLQWSGGAVRIVDNTAFNFGTDDDIQFMYDAATDNRLEVTDGTNLLLALTDNGSNGTLTVNGTVRLGTGTNDELRTSSGSAASASLYWGNQLVCLQNGTGCSTSYGLWEALTFNSGNNTGTFENDNDVIIGTYSGDNTPLTNASFILDAATADDLYVVGLLGVSGSAYVESSILAGSSFGVGGLTINDSGLADSNSNLVLSSSSGVVAVSDDLLIQTTTPSNVIIDNSTTGATADSGALILRGNYFNVSDTEMDMRFVLDVVSSTDYKFAFYNDDDTTEIAGLDESGNLQLDGVLNLGTNTNDVLSVGPTTAANGDLYWGDDLICDTSESNCGIAFGGSSLFTDGGSISYLTQDTDDFAIGASNTLSAPFSVDVDGNVVRIGDGANDANDPTLSFFASDASNSGSLSYLDSDNFSFSGGNVFIGASSETIAGAGFSLGGDELFVNGDLGVEGNIYSDGDINLQTDTDTTGAGDIAINFGGTNTEVFKWDATADGFDLSDDIKINGNIEISGSAARLVYANVATGNAPTCDSTTVGSTIYNRDSSENGTLYLCRQNSSDTYEWRDITVSTGTPDLAEFVHITDSTIESGDIVSVSATEIAGSNQYNNFIVEKATESSRNMILGVISTNPGIILNTDGNPNSTNNPANIRPLALAGRIPVKVASDSKEIKKGDYLTVSATQSGKAVKAINKGKVIGVALENWQPVSGAETVMMLVDNNYFDPNNDSSKVVLGEDGTGVIGFDKSSGSFSFDSDGDGIAELIIGKDGKIEVNQQVLPQEALTNDPQPTITPVVSDSPSSYFGEDYTGNTTGEFENKTGLDRSEKFEVEDGSIGVGEVVKFKQDALSPDVLDRTNSAQDSQAIGVIAANPDLFLNGIVGAQPLQRPVALMGRTPVKVTDENGPIHRGDFLTPASTPGYAMKANGSGIIIGRAMEEFDPAIFAEGDSDLIASALVAYQAQAIDQVNELLEKGIISEEQATEILSLIQTETLSEMDVDAEKTRIIELLTKDLEDETEIEKITAKFEQFKLGRIMMFVDVNFAGEDIYSTRAGANGALQINQFSLESGDNLFDLVDNPDYTKLTINIDELIVAGTLVVERDLDVLGVFRANVASVNNIYVQDKFEAGDGEGQVTGKVTIPAGKTRVVVSNTNVTPKSSIHLTSNQFGKYRVTEIKPVEGFVIEIEQPIEQDTVFNFFVIN